ncbi:HDOD domain-containing protein [Motiliproteus sp. MSK22-1]|uniref:HDOD domain-containing protein n=1 Tax=Motiliproteus sp. MSK22-1 TaxID=1897630 RepID=UPI0009762CFE|nr:HDOD domain-containing protein [Motiliproteus sp. MSK22-1]OMH25895.1 hypothetical protein BGP75_25630 [Motiliproteus sp. MSK22-1]
MEKELLERLKIRLNQPSPFPGSVQSALAEMDVQPLDINAVCQYLELDPILASAILRLANSPFYGFARKIGKVQDAAVLLGVHSLRQLVISFSLVKSFNESGNDTGGLNRNALWRHSVAVAVVAKILAEKTGHNPDDAFIAGMLHDVGQFILEQCFVEEYAKVLQYRDEKECGLCAAERKLLGIDHGQVAAAAIHKWKLPEHFVEVAKYNFVVSRKPPSSPLTALVHLADVLVKGLWISPENDVWMVNLCPDTLDLLGLDWDRLEKMLPEMESMSQDVIGRFLP